MAQETIGRFAVTGTATQIGSVKTALADCQYPVADKLPRTIPVTFSDLTSQDALGLFWTSGKIEIEQTLPPAEAAKTFLAEAWHAIDQYLLTNADRAALLVAAHGGKPDGHTWFDNNSYYADLGETMMDIFLAAYTPYTPTGIRWFHQVTPALVGALRTILTPAEPPPAGPTQPGAFPWPAVQPWLDRAYTWSRAEKAAKNAIRVWRSANA